jgi:signal transduction histidine kinase
MSLLCDAGRIGQLLSNLLKNALVHGDPDHPIDVSAVLVNGVFKLSVTNVGPRIPEETVSQFFKPFWRGSNKSTHEGLGLGLFIVSQIAKSHRGAVSVVNTGPAITFAFTIYGPDFVERRSLPRV